MRAMWVQVAVLVRAAGAGAFSGFVEAVSLVRATHLCSSTGAAAAATALRRRRGWKRRPRGGGDVGGGGGGGGSGGDGDGVAMAMAAAVATVRGGDGTTAAGWPRPRR